MTRSLPSPGQGDDITCWRTIAVLMAATILSQYQFNHTIKFVAFSGEEQGLLGSAVSMLVFKQPNADWNIVGVLNCDMISYAVTATDGRNLIVFGKYRIRMGSITYTNNINTGILRVYWSSYTRPWWSPWGSDHNSSGTRGMMRILF